MISVTDVRAIPGDSAFLIDDGKTALLYDSGFGFTGKAVLENIKKELGARSLDYIFLTHSHYDHVLGVPHIKKHYSDAVIVAGEYCKSIFSKPSARSHMRELDLKYAAELGITEYEDLTDELTVDVTVTDGECISAGDMKFTAIALPGHTKCSFGFYLESEKILLSSETLGVFLGERSIVPSFLIGYRTTLNSIDRAHTLDVERILIPHFGLADAEDTEYYLSNSKRSAVQTCRDIALLLKNGGSKDEALALFKDKFYHGKVIDAYPLDAMELNTGIMIDLIEKELLN